MPRIFDNIIAHLLPAIRTTFTSSYRADFCVGYFNLRGWKEIQEQTENFAGGLNYQCRILVGMQKLSSELLEELYSINKAPEISNASANKVRQQIALEFRNQLMAGAPTNADEAALRDLVRHIRENKVVIKLFLSHSLHAKLYLFFRDDHEAPRVGYLGSSNLTFAGLSSQGELNIDVVDSDASQKLAEWFQARWDERLCIDISKELIEIINDSWAREELIPPYHIYLKMAYHLSQEARTGVEEFTIPPALNGKLLEFQEAAVKIAAHHLNSRGGVLVGDVVGLGKTIVGTALAAIFDQDFSYDTLIICPKNLTKMWQWYKDTYRLRAEIMSISLVDNRLPTLRRYQLIIIDESHNLRNREGMHYKVIEEYIKNNDSKVIMLTATPYNKTFLDLSSQLRLFLEPEKLLPIKPETYIREIGELEFNRRHQVQARTLAAFEKSEHPEDWQDLMRLYMVRRTRTFIKTNYAHYDPDKNRKYLLFKDGSRSYFPDRVALTEKYTIDPKNVNDQYARLYAEDVVVAINKLNLPRYGLGQAHYVIPANAQTPQDQIQLEKLSKAGKRLLGFARTGLFKRLESSGYVFLLSIERHIVRNYVFLYAIENDLPLPIGTQDVSVLDSRVSDADLDGDQGDLIDPEYPLGPEEYISTEEQISIGIRTSVDFMAEARRVYAIYRQKYLRRYRWIDSKIFSKKLYEDLEKDAVSLIEILSLAGKWHPADDTKLNLLYDLITKKYPSDKVLVFSQYSDTVEYLSQQLSQRGVNHISGVTGNSGDPTDLALRFSPQSNDRDIPVSKTDELRVLIATDVLSEGQNLQDGHVIINYDLPWAIIRLIQRAGRVDRIGQNAEKILVHTFLPAEGVEKIINLRRRLQQRLKENAEVVGSDETFFEKAEDASILHDLYSEKAGILDGTEDDSEVDLASYAFQIWKNAIESDPSLEKKISNLPNVVYSAKNHIPNPISPSGVLVHVRSSQNIDSLGWFDLQGNSVTENQYQILKAAECTSTEPAIPHHELHHSLVISATQQLDERERSASGNLGRPSGARYRVYERLKNFISANENMLFVTQDLRLATQAIFDRPLRNVATDSLNRQLRANITDHTLAEMVVSMYLEDRLVMPEDADQTNLQPRIISSLGLY